MKSLIEFVNESRKFYIVKVYDKVNSYASYYTKDDKMSSDKKDALKYKTYDEANRKMRQLKMFGDSSSFNFSVEEI